MDERDRTLLTHFYEIINTTCDFQLQQKQEFIDNSVDVLTDFLIGAEKCKLKNEKESCDFNIFSIFAPAEKTHSYILANLLNPNAEHGQKYRFLRPFLEMLNITLNENKDKWIVTAEKGRIDVLLRRIDPHSVIIVENKSNLAVDQENQLYRYWYKQIYLPNTQKTGIDPIIEIKKYSKQEKNGAIEKEIRYSVVYLTPQEWKQPSDNSLSRPKQLESILPELPILPIEPTVWRFNKDLVDWLNKSLGLLEPENHRMREYVKQYIEYWS